MNILGMLLNWTLMLLVMGPMFLLEQSWEHLEEAGIHSGDSYVFHTRPEHQ